MGLTETGYRRRTWDEILNSKIAKAKELFGNDINTDENTALGKYIRINTYDQYAVEELAELIYYSINPQTAMGDSLDRLCWTMAISRNAAVPARYSVDVTGTAGTSIDYGFEVATETGLKFYCVEDTAIGDDGTCKMIVECVEAGTIGNVPASAINVICKPSADIEAVFGDSLIQTGIEEESDYDLRSRFATVREGKGSCSEASIVSALRNVPTVKGVYVKVNESATETVDNVPPKAIACYIDGGSNYHQQIAEAIFNKKPVGVATHGNISVPVSYGSLKDYNIKFSSAEAVNIYIDITEFATNAEYKADGNETVKNNLATFIGNLGIGNPLITTALYSQIYSVAGVVSSLVTVSTDGVTYDTGNISVQPYQYCFLKEIKIKGVVV